MNKNLKAVIACAAVLVLVGGGYVALMLTDNGSEKNTNPPAPIAVKLDPLLTFEKNEIKSISVKNAEGGYEAVPTGKTDEGGVPVFEIKGLEDLPRNESIILSLVNNSSALSCDKVVKENETELEKYGLKEPAAEVTIVDGNGEKTLLVGNESPQSGETYCMMKGSSDVFLAGTTAVSVFRSPKERFLSTTVIAVPEDGQKPIAENITIRRDDIDYDIVLKKDEFRSESGNTAGTMSAYYMDKPVFSYIDVERSNDTVQGFYGLTASSVIKARPAKEEIKAYGLDAPFCTVSVKLDDKAGHVLKIGKKLDTAGDYYAVMTEEADMVYSVAGTDLCWLTVTPGDIMSRLIFGTYVWDVGRLKITAENGEAVEFIGKGKDEDDYEITKNGEPCDKKRFQKFYQYLLKASAEDFDIEAKAEGTPVAKIELESQDGQVSQTVEFYRTDTKMNLIAINGSPCFKCREAYAELLISNLAKFDGSEEFVMNW